MLECLGSHVLWLSPLLSFVAALVGVYVAHYFASKRDVANKSRELVTKHLIEIWQSIEGAHKSMGTDKLKILERCFADIQLFGSQEQIDFAKQFSDDIINNNGNASSGKFLESLRSGLRRDLGLGAVNPKTFQFFASGKLARAAQGEESK